MAADHRRGLVVARTGRSLKGPVHVSGSKHAFAHTLAVAAMCEGAEIEGVPRNRDADALLDCVRLIFEIVELSGSGTLTLASPKRHGTLDLSAELLNRSRNLYCLLPALLNRSRVVRLSGRPKGCDFEARPDEWYFQALTSFGASVEHDAIGGVRLSWPRRRPGNVALPFPSVTTSIIGLAAALGCYGSTTLSGVALEPSVRDAFALLSQMGTNLELHNRSVVIHSSGPPETLSTVLRPDQEVAVTLLSAVAIAGGNVRLIGRRPFELERFRPVAHQIGLRLTEEDCTVTAVADVAEPLHAVEIVAGPNPMFASDWIPPVVLALAAKPIGHSRVIDTLFPDRLRFLEPLRRLGLKSVSSKQVIHHGRKAALAEVHGSDPPVLNGGTIGTPTDLRGAACLVLASLITTSAIVISDDTHLRRGYEDLPKTLEELGCVTYEYV
ncbi:hypothetical protein ACIA58_26420 [Kribbella sp. NPDC051586]|uniref:hypothetical protein n=1 Tax=Kribbella sp. NPDC051586 TaxID=3364118 RepID=UPI003789634B